MPKRIPKYKQKEFLNIRPSASAIKKHRDAIREVFDKMKAAPQEALIRRLNPIIRAWTHEYQHVTSRETFSKLDYWLWEKLWKWSKRRHPNKGSGWVKGKYFTKTERKSSDFIADNQSIHWYGMVKTSPYQNPLAGKSYYESETYPYT
ncbi:MAG: group II intron maturase-specific domain-containing protein [Pseudomonadota bacterium]